MVIVVSGDNARQWGHKVCHSSLGGERADAAREAFSGVAGSEQEARNDPARCFDSFSVTNAG